MTTFTGIQILLVGSVLGLSGLAKLLDRELEQTATRSALAVLMPLWIPLTHLWRVIAAIELATATSLFAFPGSRWPAAAATAVLAVSAAYVVAALRHAPAAPCGCFGASSTEATSWRTLARVGAVTLAALTAAAGGGSYTMALSEGWPVGVILAELAVVAGLSPELPAAVRALAQRRQMPACTRAFEPLEESLKTLRRSTIWSELRPYVRSEDPVDHWRDGCWRFVCYDAAANGTTATAVFAIRVRTRNECRGALVEAASDNTLVPALA